MAGIRQTNNRPGRYRISTGKSAGSARSSRSSRTAADDERTYRQKNQKKCDH